MGSFDIQVECPRCGAEFAVSRIRAGRQEPCPVCQGAVQVPAQAAGVPERGSQAAGPAVQERLKPVAAASDDSLTASPEDTFEEEAEERPVAYELPVGGESSLAAVCCADEKKPNPLTAGQVVARYTGLNALEARRHVAMGLGLLADGIGFERARNLVAELAATGTQAFAIPTADVPRVAGRLPFQQVHGADQQALYIQTDAQGAVAPVSWERLAAGVVTRSAGEEHVETEFVTETEYVPGAGLLRYAVPRRSEPREAEVLVTLAVVQSKETAGLLVFDERQVRYAYLGERLQPSHEQNFRLFLGDVLRWGRGAFFSGAFRAAARGDHVHIPKVVGKAEYGNHVRWAMCCAAALGKFGGR